MKIIPIKSYKTRILGFMSVLVLLTLIFVITIAIIATRPNLVVKNGLGTYDAKHKVFYPNFDDLKVQELYNNQYPEGQEVGLRYSDIFKDADKSLLKYTFSGNGVGSSNFLKLKSTETTITLQRKVKNTFSRKKKDFNIKVNWKNVMFVRDGDKEITSLLKSRVEEQESFSDLKAAYNFRYSTLSKAEKETNSAIDFSNYYVGAISHGGGVQICFKK